MQDPIITETEACGSLHDEREHCSGCDGRYNDLDEDGLCRACHISNQERWKE